MSDYIQRAFNAGEICEEALARDDIAPAARGVRWALNGFFLVHGGWRRRKGTWFVAAPKTGAGDFQLQPFTRAYGQSVVLEIGYASGAGYYRVYGLDRARVGTVEVVAPFLQGELNGGLSFLQTGDALQVYRRNNKRVQVITRTAALTWACANLVYRHGPWLPENITATTLTFSSNLTASVPQFDALHNGAKYLLRPNDGYEMDAWHSDWRPPNSGYCLSAGYVYQQSGTVEHNTGTNPPVHTSGSINDGGTITAGQEAAARGVVWAYRHDGAGQFTVDGVGSSTVASGALDFNPFSGGSATTKRWRENAYNDFRGWPGMTPCIREQRIVTGCTLFNPDTLDLTRTNGWDLTGVDYKPGLGTGLVVGDDAIRRTVGGNGAPLVWAVDREGLVVASAEKLFLISGGATDAPLKPDSATVRAIPGGGSAAVVPAETPQTVLFPNPSRKGLMELSGADGQYNVAEISLLFQHITGKGIAAVHYMRAPWHLVVLRLDDGSVSFVSYNKDQNVLGAARQDFGGRVFSTCVVPGPTGEDQLWIGIDRGTAETPVRSIEVMAGFDEKMFLDSAMFSSTPGSHSVSGLSRLNGKTVQVHADGQWHDNRLVASGSVALLEDYTADYIVVGLGYRSRLEFMPVGDAREAWAQLKARPNRVKVTARYTVCSIGTCDDETGDARPDVKRNKNRNGKWTETREVLRATPFATTGEDKRVFVEVEDAPFDLVVYGAKVGVETR